MLYDFETALQPKEVEPVRELTEEDKLYAIPEDLKGEDTDGRYQINGVAKNDADGGPMAWNTGIAEVELPIEFKLKNIEETEKMKSRQMSGSGNAYGGRGGANKYRGMSTVGNMTANYNHHRKEWAQMMRTKGPGADDGKGGKGEKGDG